MSLETPDSTASPVSIGASSSLRWIIFGIVTLACIVGVAAYVWHVKARSLQAQRAQAPIRMVQLAALPAPASAISPASGPATAVAAATGAHFRTKPSAETGLPLARPFLLYRSTALGESYGKVGANLLDALNGDRLVSPLQCERVHYAAGHGICLEARRDLITTYHAHLFDRTFTVTKSFDLAGPPSRARMSPDGRLAAVTVFVNGHSYASTDFTTRTSLIDAASGTMLAPDLESFVVERDGRSVKAADFNFWGVTFTHDARQFYATLGTSGQTLLVRGDLASRRMTVLRDGVECPSLSPDNRKIAFKHRHPRNASGRITWGLSVLDLASGDVTRLEGEVRNVDDQVEWLNDRELLYAMPEDETRASASTNIWVLAADGTGAPRPWLSLAYSPAVVARP